MKNSFRILVYCSKHMDKKNVTVMIGETRYILAVTKSFDLRIRESGFNFNLDGLLGDTPRGAPGVSKLALLVADR